MRREKWCLSTGELEAREVGWERVVVEVLAEELGVCCRSSTVDSTTDGGLDRGRERTVPSEVRLIERSVKSTSESMPVTGEGGYM